MGMTESLFAGINVAQSYYYHRNELAWNEVDYYLQVRQVHMDTLNHLREDLRDLYQVHKGKIDNGLIVTTLMLSIGFGFVVEGTFPPEGMPKLPAVHVLRAVYAGIAGVALVMPFWSLLCLMECRRRLDYFMDRFTHEVYEKFYCSLQIFVEESSSVQGIRGSELVSYTQARPQVSPGLPRLPTPQSMPCPHRAENGASSSSSRLGGLCPRRAGELIPGNRLLEVRQGQIQPPDSINDTLLFLEIHHHYTDWWNTWCSGIWRVSSFLYWGGLVCNVTCAAVLLGLYFQANYPETPDMWHTYVCVVLFGLVIAIPTSVSGLIRGPGMLCWSREPSQGLPPWMRSIPRKMSLKHALDRRAKTRSAASPASLAEPLVGGDGPARGRETP